MDFLTLTLSTGSVATVFLEGIKWLYCKAAKLPIDYPFPPKFYAVSLPILNFLVVPVLALLGFEGYALPTELVPWLQTLGQVVLVSVVGAFISVGAYKAGVKPFKEYALTTYSGKKAQFLGLKKAKK